jgi:hypothetical protein
MLFSASKRLKKEKSKHHHNSRRLLDVSVCLEELMDTPTFKRFNSTVDAILDAAEDIDLASIRGMWQSSNVFAYYCKYGRKSFLDSLRYCVNSWFVRSCDERFY